MTYRIISRTSGLDLGTFEADSEQGARDALARDMGYRDAAHAAEASGDDGSHLVVEQVETQTETARSAESLDALLDAMSEVEALD